MFMDRQTFHGFLVFGLKKLVDPNESFFWSLFAPRPETDAQHRAHSLRAREGKVAPLRETAAEWSSRDTKFLTLAGSRWCHLNGR